MVFVVDLFNPAAEGISFCCKEYEVEASGLRFRQIVFGGVLGIINLVVSIAGAQVAALFTENALVIADRAGSDASNQLTFSMVDPAYLEIRGLLPLVAPPPPSAAIQVDGNTIRVPGAEIQGQAILVSTLAGDDELVLDLSGGPFPATIHFDAGETSMWGIGFTS